MLSGSSYSLLLQAYVQEGSILDHPDSKSSSRWPVIVGSPPIYPRPNFEETRLSSAERRLRRGGLKSFPNFGSSDPRMALEPSQGAGDNHILAGGYLKGSYRGPF